MKSSNVLRNVVKIIRNYQKGRRIKYRKKTLRIEFFDQPNGLVPIYTWSSFRDKISLSNQEYDDISLCTNVRIMLIDEYWMIEDTISFDKDNKINHARR